MGLTLLTLSYTCSSDVRGGDNKNNENNDDSRNDSGGNLTHVRVTQNLTPIPC